MENLSFKNELHSPNWKIRPKQFLLYFFISVIFAILQIQQSLHQGQLSLPPFYDDVSYFNDALLRLNIFYDQGFRGLISNYVVNPPHSFMSTFLAFTGFAILGIQDWAPSLMNSIIIFTVLIFLDYSTRGLNFLWKILITIISLSWLLMGHAIIEFRPDIFCGLLTAIAVILITEKSWLSITQFRQIGVGIIVGLSLITKPTVFPVTIVLMLSSFLTGFLVDKYLFGIQYNLKEFLCKSKLFFVSFFFVSLIYYSVGTAHVVNYIYQNQFVNLQKVWNMYPLPFGERVGFYLTGQGGQMMTKNWIYLWLILAVISLGITLANKYLFIFYRSLPLFVTIFISYFIVTLSDHKSPFLGVIISCFLFLTTIKMLSFIVNVSKRKTLNKKVVLGFILGLAMLSIILFEWPAPNDLVAPNPNTMSERKYYNDLIPRIYQDLMNEADRERMRANGKPLILYLSSMAHWLHSDSIKYYQYKLKQDGILTNDGVLSDNMAQKVHDIEKSDFILSFSTPSSDTPDWLPSVRIEPKIIDFLNQSPNFKLLKTYTNPYTQAKVYLYKNKTL